MFKRSLAIALPALCVPLLAQAHVSLKSGPVPAATTTVAVFGVGHGCEGETNNLDTTSITLEIPAGVTNIRPELSGFDSVALETDKTGAVVAVTWTRDGALADDFAYYELKLRMKAPDAAFTKLKLPAHQGCSSADGSQSGVADWVGEEGDAELLPAPYVYIVPEHFAGWNKYTPEVDIDDLEGFFKDAEIVWQGKAAYSANPTTVELIAATDGVESLASIKSGQEIWVKY